MMQITSRVLFGSFILVFFTSNGLARNDVPQATEPDQDPLYTHVTDYVSINGRPAYIVKKELTKVGIDEYAYITKSVDNPSPGSIDMNNRLGVEKEAKTAHQKSDAGKVVDMLDTGLDIANFTWTVLKESKPTAKVETAYLSVLKKDSHSLDYYGTKKGEGPIIEICRVNGAKNPNYNFSLEKCMSERSSFLGIESPWRTSTFLRLIPQVSYKTRPYSGEDGKEYYISSARIKVDRINPAVQSHLNVVVGSKTIANIAKNPDETNMFASMRIDVHHRIDTLGKVRTLVDSYTLKVTGKDGIIFFGQEERQPRSGGNSNYQ